MISSLLLCVILALCFDDSYGFDCSNSSPGVSFIPCRVPLQVASTGGGSGGPSNNNDNTNMNIDPCMNIDYNGKNPQRYVVTDEQIPDEYDLLFTTLNIPDGEKLLIKSVICEPDNECKIAVIDSTATAPVTINMHRDRFVLTSSSNSVSTVFHLFHKCNECFEDDTCCVFGNNQNVELSECAAYLPRNTGIYRSPKAWGYTCNDECKCGYYKHGYVTRAKGKEICTCMGAHLGFIKDSDDQEFAFTVIVVSWGGWIGLKKTASGDYEWDDGTALETHHPWRDNDLIADCVVMVNYTFWHWPCDDTTYTYCEMS